MVDNPTGVDVRQASSVNRHPSSVSVKASLVDGNTASQNINSSLASHPIVCIIWILIDDSLNFQCVLWFGVKPALTKAKKEIPESVFENIADISTIAENLFGK